MNMCDVNAISCTTWVLKGGNSRDHFNSRDIKQQQCN